MRFKKVIEGYGTSYNDLKSGTNKPTDLNKILDKAKEPVKATDKKGSQVDVISTAGEKDVVVQHKNKKKEIVNKKELTIEDLALEFKLKKATSIKNKYRKLTNKLARKHLKEQPAELYEINFRRKEIGKEALDAPVKCGFEAETFFYNVEGRGPDVDEMSIGDIEYEYGDMPDQVWEDFEEWLYSKGQDEYLDDIINDKVEEVREDEDYLNDFIDSGDGPSSEAIERYKKDFEEDDPNEYENREEDGWEYMNWVREYVEEEYENEYLDWLRRDVQEDNDLDDQAREAARDDYSIEDWIYDNWSYMSSFLQDYGYDYYESSGGDVEGVADELHNWIKDNSKFDSYPESGDYDNTNTTTAWAVETDSSIDPDQGTGAELISPVFDSPRKMLTEMKSLFDWSEKNFGTNRSTGLHVTMSWQGKKAEQNKLKMALLLGDEYLLAEFGRLRNSYTKSQYRNVLKYAEGMKRGDAKSFKQFEEMLSKGIDAGKFNSIHFKGEKDGDSGNNLIEFRIAGGSDYNTYFTKVFNATVRYATIMKAGYEEDAFREDYVKAVFRLLRKSQEIDPKKLKDLEVVNHEVIDSAKSIVGKNDYFDVIKFLSASVEYLQDYEKLSSPSADKEWKQEIKDYEKGTGDKVEIEEETIRGYIKPNTMAPSKRAAGELDKAQERFGSAITLLARDIADGNNRAPVSAKSIASFRKFAKELQLNTDAIEKLALSGVKNFNLDGSDKEKVARIQKGVNTLFRQDIVKQPDYLSPQDLDSISSKMWQFFQSDDSKDNGKIDKLADLLVSLSPSNNRADVDDILRELPHERAQNGFVAKLKGSGWNTRTALLKSGSITTKDSAQELLKFLEPYQGYEHPTSKDHHVNIKSDDPYAEVAQMTLVQKLRHRLDHLNDLSMDDKDKYNKIKPQLVKIAEQLISTIGLDDDEELQMRKEHGISIGEWCLVLSERDTEVASKFLNDATDEDSIYNFVTSYDDYIIRNSLSMLPRYFKGKQPGGQSEDYTTNKDALKIIKRNFAGFKKFLNAFDKIFTAEGFTDLKAEISNKDRYDKRNKDFEKNVRDNAKAKLNIPSHSWVYIDKDFFDTITDDDYEDRAAYLDNHIEHFNDKVNQSKVYVIPSSHFVDAEDATNGLELIDKFEKNKNYYHTWRKNGYRKILNRFTRKYGYSWKDIIDPDKFIQGDGDVYEKLKGLGIEITHKGDSRKGAPGQEDLFPDEETQNPKSGEPLNRSSGISWENMDDDAEQKRFDAFDWEQYPAKMKDVVAKEMANKESSAGSFKVALDNILKKVLDGDVDIDKDDLGKPLDKLAIAAGIDPDGGNSSNGIASETDWGNLADHLGIVRGVNDQGVELLRVVYNRIDGNHNWRPAETDENGNAVIGLRRWGAAVREAEKYIRDNYNVSGGNYFRKDADGNDGDNVSDIYGTPEQETDYDVARQRYPQFDRMMQDGMQNYLQRDQVNDLVDFLNNDNNDPAFKLAVLNTLKGIPDSGIGPTDLPSLLSSARMNMSRNNESVFDKFDKLPLEEQLLLVEQSVVLEKWSKKHKDSINCSNPKGFSQKAHCAGKKKTNEEIRPDKPAKSSAEYIELGFAPDSDKVKRAKEYEQWVERQRAKGKDVDESVFDRFDKLPLEEQLLIVSKSKVLEGTRCWKGYKKKGMKTMFGKRVPNCVKNEDKDNVTQVNFDLDKHFKVNPTEPQKAYDAFIGDYLPFNFSNGMELNIMDEDYDPNYTVWVLNDVNGKQIDMGEKADDLVDLLQSMTHIPIEEDVANFDENFADGKKKGKSRPGRVKRAGASCKGSVTSLRKKAKNSSGEKAKMYHWCANMKGGKKKANEHLQNKLKLTVKANEISESLMMTEVDRVKDINDILSAEFPVNNYKLQMKAFVALPVPEMLDAFKELHARYGAKSDAREIVRHFAKSRMPKEQLTKINLGV